mmetsp:Transcript_80477/g.250167  ORF Transcript_80477/g.250167 Transcript_80477/m.250167 type:complete len:448 (+) Transcript_80477:30-1373(+)
MAEWHAFAALARAALRDDRALLRWRRHWAVGVGHVRGVRRLLVDMLPHGLENVRVHLANVLVHVLGTAEVLAALQAAELGLRHLLGLLFQQRGNAARNWLLVAAGCCRPHERGLCEEALQALVVRPGPLALCHNLAAPVAEERAAATGVQVPLVLAERSRVETEVVHPSEVQHLDVQPRLLRAILMILVEHGIRNLGRDSAELVEVADDTGRQRHVLVYALRVRHLRWRHEGLQLCRRRREGRAQGPAIIRANGGQGLPCCAREGLRGEASTHLSCQALATTSTAGRPRPGDGCEALTASKEVVELPDARGRSEVANDQRVGIRVESEVGRPQVSTRGARCTTAPGCGCRCTEAKPVEAALPQVLDESRCAPLCRAELQVVMPQCRKGVIEVEEEPGALETLQALLRVPALALQELLRVLPLALGKTGRGVLRRHVAAELVEHKVAE